MKTLGTTIEVTRGEVFTLNRTIVDVNGVPYILPKSFVNPYLIISIVSNTFEQEGRFEKNYWLSLKNYVTFDYFIPLFIESLNNPPSILGALYYTNDGYGGKQYYYWDTMEAKYRPYSFSFSKLFLNSDTRQWVESIYKYQLKLASGQSSIDWLTNIYNGLYPDADEELLPTDKYTLANYICKLRPDLLEDVDWKAPIVNYVTKDILKQPAKLIVRKNM